MLVSGVDLGLVLISGVKLKDDKKVVLIRIKG